MRTNSTPLVMTPFESYRCSMRRPVCRRSRRKHAQAARSSLSRSSSMTLNLEAAGQHVHEQTKDEQQSNGVSGQAPLALDRVCQSYRRCMVRRWQDDRQTRTTAEYHLGTATATWLDARYRWIGLGKDTNSTVNKTTRRWRCNGGNGNNRDPQARRSQS
jgi:hypothetical protein